MINFDDVYHSKDGLPGFYASAVSDVWVSRLHLSMDEMAEDCFGFFIQLKQKDGTCCVTVPTFEFDENGEVLPTRMDETFVGTFEDHWVVPHVRSAIDAAVRAGERPRFVCVVTTDAWLNRVGVACTEFELEPAPDFVDIGRPLFQDAYG